MVSDFPPGINASDFGSDCQVRVQTGVAITSYRYDHTGIQTHVTASSVTQSHLIDAQNPTGYAQRAVSTLSTGAQTRRVFGDDLLFEDNGLTPSYHLTYDGQGTTRGVINSSGALAESYAFDAYGEPRDGIALTNPLTDHLYTGEPRDAATGWTYLRARYLDTSTGTFNRLDPFFGNTDDPQSLHKYAYVHGDPVNAWDPSGESLLTLVLGSATFRTHLRGITFGVIRGAVVGGLGAGSISAIMHIIQNRSFDGAIEAFLSGALLGALWGAGIGGAAAISTTILSILIIAALGDGFRHLIPLLADSNIRPEVKVLAVGLWIAGAIGAKSAYRTRVAIVPPGNIRAPFPGREADFASAWKGNPRHYDAHAGEVFYRLSSRHESSSTVGEWFFRTEYKSVADAKSGLAIIDSFSNVGSHIVILRIPPGKRLVGFIGKAARQEDGTSAFDGGGEQFYFRGVPNEWTKTTSSYEFWGR